jgi:hypothetical protein
MPVTLETLKTNQQDYLLAYWENGELVMEPFCHCGNALEEDFLCKQCARECDCTFIACKGADALAVVEKLLHSNPNFRNYQASLLDI